MDQHHAVSALMRGKIGEVGQGAYLSTEIWRRLFLFAFTLFGIFCLGQRIG